jgi:hypothetical protein
MSDDIYEYKKVNVSLEHPPTIEAAANRWAAMGWRTVAVMAGDRAKGYADVILIERKKPKKFPIHLRGGAFFGGGEPPDD